MKQNLTELTKQQLDSSNISDDLINELYNVFSAEQMRTYKGVSVRLDRNFRRRKISEPTEWNNFVEVVKLCNKYDFNPKIYVKYCFLHRLAPHNKGRVLKDIEYLTHYQQVVNFAQNKKNIEYYYNIYISVMKSAMRIKNTTKEQNNSASNVIKNIICSGRLTDYLITGVISRYFISLIPNIASVIYELTKNSNNDDLNVISDLCETIPEYSAKAAVAMRMFNPLSINQSILKLCS